MRRHKQPRPVEEEHTRTDGRFLGYRSHSDRREAWRIVVRCKADATHAKILELPLEWEEDVIEKLALILSGKGNCFIHPPGDLCPVGLCVVCGNELEATFEKWRNF